MGHSGRAGGMRAGPSSTAEAPDHHPNFRHLDQRLAMRLPIQVLADPMALPGQGVVLLLHSDEHSLFGLELREVVRPRITGNGQRDPEALRIRAMEFAGLAPGATVALEAE